jgi:hypothetical protein
MKITDVYNSITFTMNFSLDDVSKLAEITKAVEDVFDCAAEELSCRDVNIDYGDLKIAHEGLELLNEMLNHLRV